MDSDPAVALGISSVEAVDGVDDLVDRAPGELVAKDIDRDLLVGGKECAEGAAEKSFVKAASDDRRLTSGRRLSLAHQ